MTSVHHSSKTDNWPTPQHLFDQLNNEFQFTVDVAADSTNAKSPRYYTTSTNGLTQSWANETVWCNPPYGRSIGKWIEKGIRSSFENATVVLLLPARTDTVWFQACWKNANEIRFIPGRLRFGEAKEPAPFPSCIVVMRPRKRASWNADGIEYMLPTRHGNAQWISVVTNLDPERDQPNSLDGHDPSNKFPRRVG